MAHPDRWRECAGGSAQAAAHGGGGGVCGSSGGCRGGHRGTGGAPRRLEREERRVLFDVLQAGWSDTTFAAERARLEEEEEEAAWADDGLTVIGVADRLEGFLADL